MDFCSVCGQGFVNEEDFYYHECFVFRKFNKIKGLKYTISYNVYYVKQHIQDCGLHKPSVATARHREYAKLSFTMPSILMNIIYVMPKSDALCDDPI